MPRHIPERTCIVTREAQPPGGLIRFALSPAGEVTPDLRERLPGRGAWVTVRRDAVAEAVRRKLFARAFKRGDLVVPADLPERVEALLLADLRQALALANKAGRVVTGFGKVEDALLSGGAAALIHAAEAKADGRRKLAQALRKGAAGSISRVPVVDVLPEAELDLALGRAHVIHAALVAGVGSDGFLARWRRLGAYRGQDTGQPGRSDPAAEPGDVRSDEDAALEAAARAPDEAPATSDGGGPGIEISDGGAHAGGRNRD